MRKYFLCCFALFLCTSWCSLLYAKPDQWIVDLVEENTRKNSLAEALMTDAKDGRLSRISLETAALIAADVPQKEWPGYLRKIDALQNSIALDPSFHKLSDEKKARYILSLLHKKVFKHYSKSASSLQKLLDEGTFNCVSSTVVYTSLLKRFGFNVSAIQTDTHVYSCVHLDKKKIAVETTHLYGFDPGKTFYKKYKNHIEYIVVRQDEHAQWKRSISTEQLLATIYFNRSYDAVLKNDFQSATLLYARGYILDPSFPQARDYITDLYLSWTYQSFLKKQYRTAALQLYKILFWKGLDRKKREIALTNITAATGKICTDLIKRKKYDDAQAIVKNLLQFKELSTKKKEFLVYITCEWTAYLLKKKRWKEARDNYIQLLKEYPGNKLARTNLQALYFEWGEIYIQQGKWDAAERVYLDACAKFPKELFYRHNLKAVYSGWALSEYNKGNHAQAERLYKKMNHPGY